MQRTNFLARGVFILAVVFALNAPAYAFPSRDGESGRDPKSRIVKIIKKLRSLLGSGDGLISPWPATPPDPKP